MFIWDFVADTVLGQITDWVYGQIVGFLGSFFAQMGNMGADLFEMEWVQAIVMFFSCLAWALYVTGLVVAGFECGIEYQNGRGSIRETGVNALKGFFAASLFSTVPVELYREFMSDISDEIDRETKIIDDLLTLVKMDKSAANQMNISQVNINAQLEMILKRLRPIAKKGNVELILESMREVTADVDEMKMSLAITNLVENAIKYNVDSGWVRVTLDADHKYFYLKVMDSGIGIPEEDVDHIFDRFFRVDKARSREVGGTGLGLAITKSIVQMHGGIIDVESVLGEGTTFAMRIPLNYIPRQEARA